VRGLQTFVMAQSSEVAISKSNVTVTSSPRVPEFNASDPEMCFTVVEAYFTKAHISDSQQR
jgi:hypothetical protein